MGDPASSCQCFNQAPLIEGIQALSRGHPASACARMSVGKRRGPMHQATSACRMKPYSVAFLQDTANRSSCMIVLPTYGCLTQAAQ